MPPRSRKSPALPTLPEIFLPDASAAASSARASLIRRPLGGDPAGLVLGFVALRLHGLRARRDAVRRPAYLRVLGAAFRAVVLAHVAFVLSVGLCLTVFKTVDPGATTLMVYRAFAYGWPVQRPRFVPLAKIPKTTRTMTVRVEDGTFYEHHGIVPAAIKHAYALNKGFGEPIYGGSTITMQTARTLFLVPEKSYLRKYLEVIVALEMEAILGKDRILELYFNYAEWGRGVFGIEAASRAHYKKAVASLSRDQAIRLVTLLSSPIRYSPYNFGRNGILLSRYSYLVKRWGDPPPEPLEPAPVPEPSVEPEAVPAAGEADAEGPSDSSPAASSADAPNGPVAPGGAVAVPEAEESAPPEITDGR
jgi:monofunctional biosynthetic peptidoglycan transglycosylase